MAPFVKRMFLPLVIGLVLLALYLFLFYGRSSGPQDIRAAVPVEKFTLSNGLKVVVMPNNRTEAVSHLLVVKAGAADDPYGKTGLAHYLEHLLFTGSKNYPEGVHDETIQRVGGEQNAYTTKDYTLYHATVAAKQLPTVMAMEADRFQNLLFSPDKVAREVKVITEERNQRIDNSPQAQFEEQLTALTFLNHPYHHPTIGWLEDMQTLTGEDAKAFFNMYYRSSNMVLVVAGNVKTSDVRRYAQRYYGDLPAGAAPKREWPHEPPLRLTRHATMTNANVHEPRLVRQYTAPSLGDGMVANALPLSIYAHYLGGGQSSILYQQLVREEHVASDIDVSYDPFAIGPELFSIRATPAVGVTLEQLEAALDRVLTMTLSQAPQDAAFTRSKTQLKAEVVFAQDGVFPLANLIAALYARGMDEQFFYDWTTTIEKITPEQARAAAAATLAPNRRVTGYMLPLPAADAIIKTEVPDAP